MLLNTLFINPALVLAAVTRLPYTTKRIKTPNKNTPVPGYTSQTCVSHISRRDALGTEEEKEVISYVSSDLPGQILPPTPDEP